MDSVVSILEALGQEIIWKNVLEMEYHIGTMKEEENFY